MIINMANGRVVTEFDARGIHDVEFSADGQRIAIGWIDGQIGASSADIEHRVEIRSIPDGNILKTWNFENPNIEASLGDLVKPGIRLSSDFNTLLRMTSIIPEGYSDGFVMEVSAWNVETGALLHEETCEQSFLTSLTSAEIMSPDDKYLLAGCAGEPDNEGLIGQMQIIELATGEVIQEIPRYNDYAIYDWADNSRVLLLNENGLSHFYNLEGEVGAYEMSGLRNLDNRFSPDGNYNILDMPETIYVSNIASGETEEITATSFGGTRFTTSDVSRDGNQIFFLLANTRRETMYLRVLDVASLEPVVELELDELYPQGFIGSLDSELWHPNGNGVAFCAADYGAVYYWDLEQNISYRLAEMDYWPVGVFCRLRYSSDGRYLAYYRQPLREEDSPRVAVIDLESREVVFDENYTFVDGLYIWLDWQAEENRLFVSNYAERKIEIHEFP